VGRVGTKAWGRENVCGHCAVIDCNKRLHNIVLGTSPKAVLFALSRKKIRRMTFENGQNTSDFPET
jgi:hypothetical protein